MKHQPWLLPSLALVFLASCGPVPPTPSTVPKPSPAATAPALPATPTPAPTSETRLVDIGGRSLWMQCQGSGSPVVILESGLGVYSGTWLKVLPEVAKFTRVCRYDRAGLGESPPGPMPRTSRVFVAELHTLLTNAAIPGPYVFVGQSLGGLNVQLYAATYPREVAGLVLLDSLHPDLDTRFEKLLTPQQALDRRRDLERNEEGIRFTDILTSEAQVRAAGPLPDVPLVVLRHGIPFDVPPDWPSAAIEALWVDLQGRLAHLTSRGSLVVAEGSHHRIQEDRPDLVVTAIRQVVEQGR